MEEYVGQLWHRLITHAAEGSFPAQAACLDEVKKTLAIQFRAFGGNAALPLLPASPVAWNSRRGWLKRIATRDQRVELAWVDHEALHLPSELAVFPERRLNRQLYFWLVALAAVSHPGADDWMQANQHATLRVLTLFPGLGAIYAELVNGHVAQRRTVTGLTGVSLQEETRICRALLHPGHGLASVSDPRLLMPVAVWLHPCPPVRGMPVAASQASADEGENAGKSENLKEKHRRRGERAENPDGRDGLLAFRLESLFSWSEYIKLDRTADDDDILHARQTADDLDVLAVTRDRNVPATRLKFDLDLPAEEYDDIKLENGILLPEWDYRKQLLVKNYCNLQLMAFRDAVDSKLPGHLRKPARMIRAQFERLMLGREWEHGCLDGTEVDLDRFVMHVADRRHQGAQAGRGFYSQLHRPFRDLSCLLLADLSLSTDAWVSSEARVIDVIRDSLFLFSEALAATRDAFSICGFSSKRRDQVRFYPIKRFCEGLSAEVYGRILAVRPGYYTRMGAAIRYAGEQLAHQANEKKLLLLLTDGKPNDLDIYEGRYGIEDTRHAVNEVRQLGIRVFAVTVDDKAHDYLPYIFGAHQYALLQRAADLPIKLLKLYSALTF